MKQSAVALLCVLALAYSPRASNESSPMTAGDLQEICTGQDAGSKAACRFYILGITQGIGIGIAIADTKPKSMRPCTPENISSSALELAVKMKLGQELMVFPEDKKLDAAGVIGAILADTFPCGKSR